MVPVVPIWAGDSPVAEADEVMIEIWQEGKVRGRSLQFMYSSGIHVTRSCGAPVPSEL